jgi:glycosyltransferase involved in cell wall biosynthesis
MTLCLATSSTDRNNMESFIQNHISNLPVKLLLYGGEPPVLFNNDETISPSIFGIIKYLPYLLTKSLSLKRLYRFAVLSRIYQLLKKEKISVVLAEYGITGTFMVQSCQSLGVPLIVHFHGYDAYKHNIIYGDVGRQYEKLFKASSALIAVSEAMKRQLISLGAPKEKIHVIRCGCNTELFKPCKPSGNKQLFLSVGRFVDKKAHYLVILAFSKLKESYPDAHLEIIGSGPLSEVCHRLVEAYQLCDSVILKGECSLNEVATRMRNARAYIQHSIVPEFGPDKGDSEGTPVAVMEAMASGLPVIATNHAGIGEIINHGENGLLVEEGDVEEMARQMERVLKNPDFADKLGKEAASYAGKHFSVKNTFKRLHSLISKVEINNS